MPDSVVSLTPAKPPGPTGALGPLTQSTADLIAESIPHIVWTAAPDGAVTYFNRMGTEYTGLPREATYDWNWLTHIHPDDTERTRAAWRHATAREAEFALDYRIRRFDGVFRWHSCRALPIRGDTGAIHMWIGTATDIEGRKQLELSLRGSEREAVEALALLETIEAAATVGFALVDTEFRIIRINEALARVNDLPRAEQLGRTVAEVVPELWPRLEGLYRRVFDGEAVCNVDVSRAGKVPGEAGRARHRLANFYPVRVGGDIVGVGVVVLDITERMEAEEFRAGVTAAMSEGLHALEAEGLLASMNRAAPMTRRRTDGGLLPEPILEVIHNRRADATALPPGTPALVQVKRELAALSLELVPPLHAEPRRPTSRTAAGHPRTQPPLHPGSPGLPGPRGTSANDHAATGESELGAVTGSQADGHPMSAEELGVWRTFLTAHARVGRRLEADLMAEHALPLASYDVLVQLVEAPQHRLRMTDLAGRVLISRSGLTRLVDRLCTDGLVRREACEQDARGLFAVLTDAGYERLRHASRTHLRGVQEYAVGRFTAEELRSLNELLQLLVHDEDGE
jgi:PAS domain S-box-containing protein